MGLYLPSVFVSLSTVRLCNKSLLSGGGNQITRTDKR